MDDSMTDLDDLFGKGLDLGNDIVAKAQLRTRVRKPRYPTAEAIVDLVTKKYEERLAAMLSDIEAEIRRDETIGKGGLYIDRATGQLLCKAEAPAPPDVPKSPRTTIAGQAYAKRGEGANPNYKRYAQGVKAAGSRGGRWYRDDKGNVRYGDKPIGRFKHAAEPHHVVSHFQKYVGKTPFLPGSSDSHDFDFFHEVQGLVFEKGKFTPEDKAFIGWFRDNFDTFLEFHDTEDDSISREDIENANFDIDTLMSYGGTSLGEKIEEFFRAMAEEYTDEDGNVDEASFLLEDEYGNPEDADDVVEAIRSTFDRYQEMLHDPEIQAAMIVAEEARQRRGAVFEEHMSLDTTTYAPLAEDLLLGEDGEDLAMRSMIAMNAMGIFRRAKAGEVTKAGLRGMYVPDETIMNHLDVEEGALQKLNTAQLTLAFTAARLRASLDNTNGSYLPVQSEDGSEIPNDDAKDKLSIKIRDLIMRDIGLEEGTPGYQLMEQQLEDIVEHTKKMASGINLNGETDAHIRHASVQDIAGQESVLQDALAKQEEHAQFVADVLEAQDDDSFEMPPSMLKGVWGSHDKEGADAAHPDHMMDPDKPERGNWKPLRYQKKYLSWMHKVKRGIIAADTGLGKTPTVITFMEQLRAQGKGQRAILILPPALMAQWPKEIARFAPDMADKVLNLDGMSMVERKAMLSDSDTLKNAEYVIMSSGTLTGKEDSDVEAMDGEPASAADDEMIDILKKLDGAMFIDEVQKSGFKTPGTGSHEVAKKILEGREYAFGLSATPIPDHPIDLYHLSSLFNDEDSIGSHDYWKGRLSGVKPTEGDKESGAEDGFEVDSFAHLAELNRKIKPFTFYKSLLDKDIIEDRAGGLTEKRGFTDDPNEGDLNISTAKMANGLSQHDYFKEDGVIDHMVREWLREKVQGHKNDAEVLFPEDSDDFEKERVDHVGRKIANYNMIAEGRRLQLQRQAAISPELIDPSYKRTDGANGYSPKLNQLVTDIVAHFARGGTSGESGLGSVVFCSYPGEAFPIVRQVLAAKGIDPSLIGVVDSEASNKSRAIDQDALNAGHKKLMLVGIRAGGAGLNLQKHANGMFFLDEPWTPSEKTQAQGRQHRTGQKHTVYEKVYRLNNTYDGEVEGRLSGKQLMVSALLGKEPVEGEFERELEEARQRLLGRDDPASIGSSIGHVQQQKAERKLKGRDAQSLVRQVFKEVVHGEEDPLEGNVHYDKSKAQASQALRDKHQRASSSKEAIEITPESVAKLKKLTQTEHLTTKHDHGAFSREWNQKEKDRGSNQKLRNIKAMRKMYEGKLSEAEPGSEYAQHIEKLLATNDRVMKKLRKDYPHMFDGEVIKTSRKSKAATENIEASTAAAQGVELTASQHDALSLLSSTKGTAKMHSSTASKFEKLGLLERNDEGEARITPTGRKVLDAHNRAKAPKKTKKPKAKAPKRDKLNIQQAAEYGKAGNRKEFLAHLKEHTHSGVVRDQLHQAYGVSKKKAPKLGVKVSKIREVKRKTTKGVEFLKLSHGLNAKSNRKIPKSDGVTQAEAAEMFNKMKRSKHKNWSEFVKEHVLSHDPSFTIKEAKESMQAVVDALQSIGLINKHKVK